jgi:hypothetical protein
MISFGHEIHNTLPYLFLSSLLASCHARLILNLAKNLGRQLVLQLKTSTKINSKKGRDVRKRRRTT